MTSKIKVNFWWNRNKPPTDAEPGYAGAHVTDGKTTYQVYVTALGGEVVKPHPLDVTSEFDPAVDRAVETCKRIAVADSEFEVMDAMIEAEFPKD